jgi:transposase
MIPHLLCPPDCTHDPCQEPVVTIVVLQRSRRGRPRGSWSIPDDKLMKRMIQAIRILEEQGDPVTQARVMTLMGIEGDTRRLREWLRRLGISWQKLKDLKNSVD